MPPPLLIFSQSECLIWIVAINSHTWWQTVQIQISWLKPTDLDLHCLLGQGMSCSARERLIGTEKLPISLHKCRLIWTFAVRTSKCTFSDLSTQVMRVFQFHRQVFCMNASCTIVSWRMYVYLAWKQYSTNIYIRVMYGIFNKLFWLTDPVLTQTFH